MNQSDDTEGPAAAADLIAAMMQPGFYPKPPAQVTHKETHISHLFFAGNLVFKIKKNVRYAFLDYGTLARRRYFLNEELRLNRRLAPSVYIGVMPICRDDGAWRLGGWGEPEEYALVMRRLPEKRMLPFLLQTHQVTVEMMRELAAVLARFHKEAPRAHTTDGAAYRARVEKQWRENLADLAPFIGGWIARHELDRVADFGSALLQRHGELLVRRAEAGWVRDAHGDLHCEHVCFAPEGVQIFDCLEFDAELRCCDLAAEMAFLLMDLEVHGGAALIEPLQSRYRELIDDAGQATLLPFFKCYRALVRAKVHALRGPEDVATAARYWRYALRLIWRSGPPFLVAACGLTGSGKSTLARELGERLGAPVLNSDVVRKNLAGVQGARQVAFAADIYSQGMTARTYNQLIREAEKYLSRGSSVILDATFTQREQRDKLAQLARKLKVPLFFIHGVASAAVTRARLAARTAAANDISDGRWEIYQKQLETQERLDEVSAEDLLELNTEAAPDQLATQCEKFLQRRLAPVH
ncbi:MAG: kinase [Deltaproteobacteria bacterium]|nr:kinase [Deltaproteobacteria bacterium]